MSHVYAARNLIPRMVKRGGGYLLNTASAAGLLSQIGSVTYAVTKHAAVALGEWLSITHGHEGIKVSVLCPQAVRTGMTAGSDGGVASVDGMLEPEQVADAVIETLDQERFLVLPHPEVLDVHATQNRGLRSLAGGHAPPRRTVSAVNESAANESTGGNDGYDDPRLLPREIRTRSRCVRRQLRQTAATWVPRLR